MVKGNNRPNWKMNESKYAVAYITHGNLLLIIIPPIRKGGAAEISKKYGR